MRLFRTITAALGLTMLIGGVLAEPAVAGPAHYRTIDLGTLGGDFSFASAINAQGDATGQAADATGALRPFRWHNGKMTDLGVLDAAVPYGFGADINNRGWVVGSSDVAGGTAIHAFLWRDGVMTDLGTLGGKTSSASAINDRGQVVGRSETATHQWHAFLWQNGQMTDLGLDTATGINNNGQIVGATPFGDQYRAYRWRKGVVTDLGDLGSGYSDAAGVNARGHVVGTSTLIHYGPGIAYLYRGSAMENLGTLGGLSSQALAINNRDEVLGNSPTATGSVHTFLWRGGKMTDLTVLGVPEFGGVSDLNDRGQIAGYYHPGLGNPRAALFV